MKPAALNTVSKVEFLSARIINDPITDPSWAELLDRHPAASIFHSPGWLAALKKTYGYKPLVVTTSPVGSTLGNGIVVCRVKGWMARRLVSVPFSDHCDVLVAGSDDLTEMLAVLIREAQAGGWRSLELRSQELAVHDSVLSAGAEYCLHRLDLRPEIGEIFGGFHPSNTQRAVRKAEREGVTYEAGRSERLLGNFYRLLRMTRRRHGLPPQPFAWFRNLVACLGDRVTIHQASKDDQPIASVLTLSFKKTMTYKYGGSDAAHHRLAGMPFLLWRVIQQARAAGFEELDLGRSDLDQSGLIAFKDHLGATRSLLTYYRYPARRRDAPGFNQLPRVARGVFSHLPDAALDVAGRLLYKHLG